MEFDSNLLKFKNIDFKLTRIQTISTELLICERVYRIILYRKTLIFDENLRNNLSTIIKSLNVLLSIWYLMKTLELIYQQLLNLYMFYYPFDFWWNFRINLQTVIKTSKCFILSLQSRREAWHILLLIFVRNIYILTNSFA